MVREAMARHEVPGVAVGILRDGQEYTAGYGITPCALSVAPLSTRAKVPQIVMAAGTSIITPTSLYLARTRFTMARSAVSIADWAATNGGTRVVAIGSA